MDKILANRDVWLIILSKINIFTSTTLNRTCKELYDIINVYISYIESGIPSVTRKIKNKNILKLKLKYIKCNGWNICCTIVTTKHKPLNIKFFEGDTIWLSKDCTLKMITPNTVEVSCCLLYTDYLVVDKEVLHLPKEWPGKYNFLKI